MSGNKSHPRKRAMLHPIWRSDAVSIVWTLTVSVLVLIAPSLADAQSVPEATSGFQMPIVNDHIGLCYKTCAALDKCAGTTYHPGVDFNGAGNDCGLDVKAVANGIVRDVCNGAPSCSDIEGNWGSVVIEHNWKGETWYSQYGHMTTVSVSVGNSVTKGQVIGDVGAIGASSCHLHWEIRELDHPDATNAGFWSCSGFLSQSTIEDWYENPEEFVNTHGPYSNATYLVGSVYHNAADTTVAPGATLNLYVRYQNAGTATWKNAGAYTDIDHVELELCNECNPTVPNWLVPIGWTSSTRVKTFDSSNPDGNTVTNGEQAVFTFQAQVPSPSNDRDVDIWFKPTHDGGVTLGNWPGQYFRIHVRNQCSGGPCPGRFIPNACVANSVCCPAAASQAPSLPDATPKQWGSLGLPAGLDSEGSYSVAFEYRATDARQVRLGFGSFGGKGMTVVGGFELPSTSEWKTFWSAPFKVTREQIRTQPNLRLAFADEEGVEVRDVRILAANTVP